MDGIMDILDKQTGAGMMTIDASPTTPDEMALDNMIEQYGTESRAVVKFYRVARGETDALLEQLPPAEFEFLHMAKKYGRGSYRVKVYAPDPNRDGRLVLRVNQQERYEGEVAAPVVMPAHTQQGSGNDALAMAIANMGKMMNDSILQLGALMVNNQSKAPDMSEMLQNMVMMRQAMGMDSQPQAGGMGGMSEMIGLLKQGIDLGRDMGGNAPEDNMGAMLRLAEKTLPSLAGLAEKAMQNRPSAPAAAVHRALPNPTLPADHPESVQSLTQVVTHPQGETEMFGINKYTPFKGQIAQLVDVVERNNQTDPYAYAVVLLDNLPDVAVNIILADTNLVNNLSEVDPRVNSHREWFNQLALDLKELTTDEEPSTVDTHVSERVPTTPADGSPS
jgi:hypothetical protein